MLVNNCIVLIDALGCSTITHEVLCTSCNLFPTKTGKEKGKKIRRTKKKRQIKCMFRTVEHKMQVAISRSTVEKG
jgi:hypothetical protein